MSKSINELTKNTTKMGRTNKTIKNQNNKIHY